MPNEDINIGARDRLSIKIHGVKAAMAANAESSISVGALRSILQGQPIENPVLQCLQIKQLASASSNVERYRTVFSDVNNFIQSMLATQINHLVPTETLQKGAFVRIKQYQTNEVKGKTIMVVLDCEVISELGLRDKIGQPEALESSGPKQEEQPQAQPGGISSNNFYGSKPQAQQQPPQQQQQQNNLPTRTNGNSSSYNTRYQNIYPIEALSPYAHKWTIKARCTHKSDIKTWHNKNGEGKLFSANFLDDSGEIRATGFKEQCDMLYDVFQEGGVYYISAPCRVQPAKKQFSNVPNDYELTFETGTTVEMAEDDQNFANVRYNFTNVADLQNVEKDSILDTIAILKEVGEVSQITSKTTSKPYDKRELTLVDNTNFSVRLTIWGNTATTFSAQPESVVAFKGVKVSDFGGRSLSLLSSGSMSIDPDIDEAHKLKGWYDGQGRNDEFKSHASVMGALDGGSGSRKDSYKTIAAVLEEELGMNPDKTDYFTLKATVVYVKKDNIAYPACRSEGCNKKVVEVEPGQWRCERCDKSFERPEYRYVLQVNLMDHTGALWVSCFDDTGRMVLGTSGDEMMALREQDENAFSEKVGEANCRTWVWRCRAKLDTFQDQQRVRYQVSSVSPLNFAAEANKLAETIKQYSLQDQENDSMFVN
ncbi:MAG: Replication factor A protein 1 [Chrysothrix sp. TS-e1954]|nr:MAG: Replication factor A protein 1 [Chrysothrix sp. TS-e1954]